MKWQTASVAVLVTMLMLGCAATDDTSLAVQTCENGVADKFKNKTYTIDKDALRASLSVADNGLLLLSGPIVISPGMTDEAKQTVQCKVRITDGKGDLIALGFIW